MQYLLRTFPNSTRCVIDMGFNVQLAKLRRQRYAHTCCPGCQRYVYQLKSQTYCKRCRDTKGLSPSPVWKRSRCPECNRLAVFTGRLCRPCSAERTQEVMDTRLMDVLDTLPDVVPFHRIPVKRPRSMRVFDWIDRHTLQLLFGFWFVFGLSIVVYK